jgi:glycosyltransferase involved in cell wall biosynthesis
LIAKDEERNLPRLLESVRGGFDQIVLVDTGSTDGTAELFRGWARRHGQRHTVDTFHWRDNFAAARTHADALLTTDWTCWADADDTIERARVLRVLAATASRDVAGFAFPYDYFQGATLVRERLIRRGRGTWMGRTHETQVIDGRVIVAGDAIWTHHGAADLDASEARDRAILRRWAADEPGNELVRAALQADLPEVRDACLAAALEQERQGIAATLRRPWQVSDLMAGVA